MSNDLATQPDSPDDQHRADGNPDQRRREANRRRKRDGMIYTRSQCLVMLSQLPGLVKAGFLTSAEASVIERILKTILNEHRQAQHSPTASAPAPANLLQLIREHPELQSWFEPLLSDEDLQKLMDESDES
jgi:hypothetical protein